MSTNNFYPQFPEIPYKRTSVEMPLLVIFAKTLILKYGIEVVRTSYCMFRNESANGTKGVNNNYAGIQADNAVWEGLDLSNVVGTCVKIDSGNDTRRFICFNEDGYKSGFDFVCYKVKQRGMFIGSDDVMDSNGLALKYLTKWVGVSLSIAQSRKADIANFKSLYSSSLKAIT